MSRSKPSPNVGAIRLFLIAALLCCRASAGDDVDFGRDILPVLADRCFQCHGGDATTREAGLRLDQQDAATASAIVPGDASASELWRRITSDDPDEVMPPPSAKKRALTDNDLGAIKTWIDAGAEYEEHWSFVAPMRPTPPSDPSGWAQTDIDRFVAKRHAERGITPSPRADRATQLRRLHLDLTGLPPTVEELDTFLADQSDGAYERAVDRLLTEDPYRTRVAERLATPWLDAARYADTIGIHTDNGRQGWAWRDWVLRAFRDDMPYDQFVTEQLAGDLLDTPTTDQLVATGFHRNHVITDEGGAINEEYLAEYSIERASTTGTVFLGLTLGCARCHDHKYDPTSQRDFFSFVSFFNSIEEPGLYSQQTDNPLRAFEPFIEVPTADGLQRLEAIETHLEQLLVEMERPLPQEDERRVEFVDDVVTSAGVAWSRPQVLAAASTEDDITLELQDDGSLLAVGAMHDFEDYVITMRSDESNLRAVMLEAFESYDETGTLLGAGRSSHHNVVLSGVTVEARPAESNDAWTEQPLIWAWADHAQQNRDYEAGNVLLDGAIGWALDATKNPGTRLLTLLAEESFGYEGGTDLRVTLGFRSNFPQHAMGRVRLSVSPLSDTTRLPLSLGRWYGTGPFKQMAPESRYEDHGPGAATSIDFGATFGEDKKTWSFRGDDDGAVHGLGSVIGSTYVSRTVWSPDARTLDISLGSDDGFVLYANGEVVVEEQVDRAPDLDQNQVTVPLRAGHNVVTMQIVNTGGPSAYAFAPKRPEHVLPPGLVPALVSDDALTDATRARWRTSWRRTFFDEYRRLDDERSELEGERDTLTANAPRAMVMREREMPRETFVLMRGAYDHPDKNQPVSRVAPGFLPALPEGAPRNRLGLAQWLVSPDNPLFARVAVNRAWQMLFGLGIVTTSDDFGIQGARPTHPALLDWLAVEFREQGWSQRELLRSIVLSETYRQSSVVRPELDELDASNRWLHRYPRRRLDAEHIRDLALFTSGLLVESLGGQPVKPYQPSGLWTEVSMTQSNTRTFEQGMADDLWRRSVYTYWKRAVPPPSLQTFDAPTRESCVIRRVPTNTPLQALVLWNDVQFVEAARVLAERILSEDGSDAERIQRLLRLTTGRAPDDSEAARILAGLNAFRDRYRNDTDAAAGLLAVGDAPQNDMLAPHELAAWSMIASATLNLHETLTQR